MPRQRNKDVRMKWGFFGRWRVLAYAGKSRSGHDMWNCVCGCGREKIVKGYYLREDKSTQCQSCARTTHGMTNTPTYISWRCMHQRCYDPNNASWPWYGALGTTVCERWFVFENFLEDMGVRPEGMTLDRIRVLENYELGNCRWATREVQDNNKRKSSSHFPLETI